MSYYVLKVLEVLHIVHDVQGVPLHVRDEVVAPQRLAVASASDRR